MGFKGKLDVIDHKGVTGIKEVESEIVLLEVSSTDGKHSFEEDTVVDLPSAKFNKRGIGWVPEWCVQSS